MLLFLSCDNAKKTEIEKQIFRYNETAGVSSLDPAYSKDQSNIWVCNQLYNGLVQLDEKLNIMPCIARTWEISEDGREYIFHLRGDVYFHKDKVFAPEETRRVVASDFVYSFNRIVNDETASPGAWVFNTVKRIRELKQDKVSETIKLSVFELNDSTLKIELNEAFSPFLGLLSMHYCSVVPREAVGEYGKEFRRNPVGTGPFRLQYWKEGVKMVLLKNRNYFEKSGKENLPYLDAVNITFIIDKHTAFLEFIKGNIDFISGLDASYKDELLTKQGILNQKYREKIKIMRQPYLNTEYLAFLLESKEQSSDDSPIHSKYFRQAINYSIDRRKMIKYLRNNIGTPGFGGIIPPHMLMTDSVKALSNYGYDYNPEKAKQLIEKSGYRTNTMNELTLYTNTAYLDLCKYIQHSLSENGISLKIEVTPSATLREMIAKSKVSFFRASWIADYPDAENYLSLFYSKNFCPQGPNYTHFSNKEFDYLYEKARSENRETERRKLYQKMDSLVMSESPVIILYYDEVLRFVQKNVIGLESNPMNLLSLKRVRKY